ncbi:hypothetical protein TNCV_4728201 [Trichonephila clavipes]|nr:hypothetical protein TNCV_4728201 [Trichonephila clavipes]
MFAIAAISSRQTIANKYLQNNKGVNWNGLTVDDFVVVVFVVGFVVEANLKNKIMATIDDETEGYQIGKFITHDDKFDENYDISRKSLRLLDQYFKKILRDSMRKLWNKDQGILEESAVEIGIFLSMMRLYLSKFC